MTKTEQMRLTAWRLRLLRQGTECARDVARTCRHFGVDDDVGRDSGEPRVLDSAD